MHISNNNYNSFVFYKGIISLMLSATKKWILIKLSSVLMVPFMIWFLLKFVSIYDSDQKNILEFFSNPLTTVFFSIFIFVSFFNFALNISEIFEDYINSEKTRKFANMMVYLSSLIIPIITLITLNKI